jgi:opacity protein-like surface antigen
MKKLALATVIACGLAAPAQAAVIANLNVNPTSATGAFHNAVGGAVFSDQYTFELVGGPQFLTIGSATNNFAEPSDFITNFSGSVYRQIGAVGGGDDILVLGPDFATLNCGVLCQGFGGAATLDAGSYYLQINGVGGGTSGYGGTLSTAAVGAVPEPSTWAMLILGFAGIGVMSMRKKLSGLRAA